MSRNGGYYLISTLLRVAYPIVLMGCILFRQTLLSVPYLTLFFALPFVPLPTTTKTLKRINHFLRAGLVLSLLNCLIILSFQIYLFSTPPYGHVLEPCDFLEKLFRHIGLVRMDAIDILSGVEYMTPDVLMLLFSFTVLLICVQVSRRLDFTETSSGAALNQSHSQSSPHLVNKLNVFYTKGKYVALLLLWITGALRPSIPNGIYYIVFLGGATWWACFKDLGKTFAVICKMVCFIAALHITTLLSYQSQIVQDVMEPYNQYARYFGLTKLKTSNCTTDPRTITYSDVEWASYVNPVAILLLYFILALLPCLPTAKESYSESSHSDGLAEDTPLISSVSNPSKYRATSIGSGLKTDPHGSVTISDTDNIQLKQLDGDEERKPNCMELTLDAIISIFQLLTRSSYIATNIIMMTWSITYHSWLTFVLLLWASVLWMIPNQRRSMLRCSPYIVLYAEFLLLSQYIYGMDLTDAELPREVNGINLGQIGFYKPKQLPCNPILAKTLFTIMFWITMRQFCREQWERRQSNALSDMAAPFRVSVGTASGPPREQESRINSFGTAVKKLMTKFWIWVVAISLFIIGITGIRITVFRIMYMALFLIFVLTFQISYKAWRKMMYGFWLTVIIYSMCILVLVYTYQFDSFPEYWEKYLGIPQELQLDIGLERFETTELFVRLLAPTFFVVITVVQLHYFHKDFLAISDIRHRGASVSRSGKGSSRSDGSSVQPEDSNPPPSDLLNDDIPLLGSQPISFRTLRQLSSNEVKLLLNWFKQVLLHVIELIMLALELHMLKILLLSIMLLCCYNITATHLILVILCVVACPMGSKVQTTIAHICSVIVSILFLATMIYQIQYIQQDTYITNCSEIKRYDDDKEGFMANNAEWLGFKKSTDQVSLVVLLEGYIGVFTVITAHAVINTRQRIRRQETGRSKPYTLFPRITRELADTNIRNCLKYLVNYGFYKFGIEICLMAIVGLIGSRMDFYALVYSFWLAILFGMSRKRLSHIWNYFMVFIAVTIALQYLFVVGVPPGLCIDYPWYNSETLRRLQNWMFLPDPLEKPSAYKIVCDFILLILVCRQSLVFRIEKRHRNIPYSGGNNDKCIKDYDNPQFTNPYLDHMTYTKSWLDLLKKGVFSAFLWITLAVTFTAGTSRVNIFSLGYLIGSFIFLWQGNDLYLRPIHSILRWWNWLMGYNVGVIFIKVILQIVGCIFSHAMDNDNDACWVVQLLGIGCVSKFGDLHLEKSPLVQGISRCSVPDADIGLAWDGVCFGFLIMQRRFFHSYYFFHHIDEAKAMTILQSRGAELIEELRQHQLQDQQAQERKVLEKIRHKMDRIKASQQKAQVQSYKEPTSHFAAIRSGDYYMFDEVDDDELDLIKEDEDESSSEHDDAEGRKRRFTMSKFLSTAMKTDIAKAADQALTAEEAASQQRTSLRRRASMPASMLRRKSSFQRRHPASVLSAPTPGTSVRLSPRPKSDLGLQGIQGARSLPSSPRFESFKPQVIESQDQGDRDSDKDFKRKKDEPVKEKIFLRLWQSFKVLWAFIESAMVSLIRTLNKISKDYRYVVRVLAQEKRELKEHPRFVEGNRSGTSQIWRPKPDVIIHLGDIITTTTNGSDTSTTDKEEWSSATSPIWLQLLLATWYAVISHSELVCYFVIFYHQLNSPTILSLPLPFMVFLWGSLTIPRPTKTFWITLIAYTEVVVVIKCLFQFEILPWNQTPAPLNNPFYPPRIVGVEKKTPYASSDLLLLLIIFFHRYMLKSLGLWKSSFEDITSLSGTDIGKVYEELSPTEEVKDGDDTHIQTNLPVSTPRTKWRFGEQRTEDNADELPLDDEDDKSSTSTTSKDDVISTEHHNVRNRFKKALVCISADDSSQTQNGDLVYTKTQAKLEKLPEYIHEAGAQYCYTTKDFFSQLLDSGSRLSADVYAYMFICDFFNFLVVLFGFSAFGTQQGDGGVSAYLEENKVPIPFLLMMILQFALIVIDRALYLRKYILGKIIFQFLLVVGVHVWMFFVLPAITERPFNALLPPQMWYMVKCFYLLMSAYQIRAGYPTRILGNFLCKKYNYINMFAFKGFMLVPFLFELRALMDWIWTDTSMTLSDWLKMEDIFAQIFQLKCQRRAEQEYPQPRGERKSPRSKYLLGGAGLFLIIAIIWFPLVLFALGNTVGESNVPYDVTISLRIGAYQYIYEMSAQNNTIAKYTEPQMDIMSNVYKKEREALTFLSNYQYDDIAVVKLSGNSTTTWGISPPDQKLLLDEVESNQTLTIKFGWRVSRVSNNPEMIGVVNSEHQTFMPPFINGVRNTKRTELAKMLMSTSNTEKPVVIENLFPKFIKITNRGGADPINKLMGGGRFENGSYRNIEVSLKTGNSSIGSVQQWWEVSEKCDDDIYKNILKFIPENECGKFLTLFTFNDKAFPATLSIISGKGIIGLYMSVVFLMWTLVRGFFTGISSKIMFDDMPNVDRILQLCLDIYLVRESYEFTLEEDLFAKLVFLYRSPETIIKWTREREDTDEEDEVVDDSQIPSIAN